MFTSFRYSQTKQDEGALAHKEKPRAKTIPVNRPEQQPKVTVISESKDLTSMTVASLFGKLREHEIEIQRLDVQESEDKHNKSITLKASKQQHVSSESEEFVIKKIQQILEKETSF